MLRSKEAKEKGENRYQYLILENLAHGLRQPHILDLKLGTQQHSGTESAAKQQRKSQRCLDSTSGSLGFRICGMQKCLPSQQRYSLKASR